jgi:phosphonatase-like hydrolase
MIKMVVFDMAGTTINEDNMVYKTIQKVLNNAGSNFSLQQVLADGAGKEKRQAIKSILSSKYGIVRNDYIEELYNAFNAELSIAYAVNEIFPQDGAVNLMQALKQKNIITILNTGYNSSTANFILNKINWHKGREYDDLITASDVEKNRPEPDMILLAMQKYEITKPDVVAKIGDSIIDIEEGKNAGCGLTIGITTGAHTYEQLKTAEPDYIINKLEDMLQLI